MSGDLISRSELLAELSNKLTIVELLGVAEIVGGIPTVEAEPVVHAHWIPCGQVIYGGWNRYNDYCSACGKRGHPDFKRCPECGAHMDEGVSDGT